MRVLIVEDTPERRQILQNLFRDHAWVATNTARRAKVLLEAFDFDIVCLDYDLAGTEKGDQVATFLKESRNQGAQVVIHSQNRPGAERILDVLPLASLVPISRMIKDNETFKRLRAELRQGSVIDWELVLGG